VESETFPPVQTLASLPVAGYTPVQPPHHHQSIVPAAVGGVPSAVEPSAARPLPDIKHSDITSAVNGGPGSEGLLPSPTVGSGVGTAAINNGVVVTGDPSLVSLKTSQAVPAATAAVVPLDSAVADESGLIAQTEDKLPHRARADDESPAASGATTAAQSCYKDCPGYPGPPLEDDEPVQPAAILAEERNEPDRVVASRRACSPPVVLLGRCGKKRCRSIPFLYGSGYLIRILSVSYGTVLLFILS
jgi:hypothetical protein